MVWNCPKCCYSQLSASFGGFDGGKKAKVLWSYRVLAVIWIQVKKKSLRNTEGLGLEEL